MLRLRRRGRYGVLYIDGDAAVLACRDAADRERRGCQPLRYLVIRTSIGSGRERTRTSGWRCASASIPSTAQD
jgi:hypothetical protein